ncbi:MAG TPA: carboxypeptidase-like regulatory domain-containing protein, partial [Flavisolibacter sp.]|nr:carboxypeptidase-like regulatory domain-containing protein [Flavisolibacter sp.]
MKKKKRLLLWGLQSLLALCLAASAWAQQTVSGTIRDDKANPVAGVTVSVKGTNRNTVTDASGRYSISAGPNDVLVFSSIGFVPKEVAVEARTTL